MSACWWKAREAECRKGWKKDCGAGWWCLLLWLMHRMLGSIRGNWDSRAPCHTPLHLFKQDRGQKEMFCQCHWNTILKQKEIQLFCCGQRRPLRQKATTSALPRWMQWPVFPTSNMSIGPWFKIWQIDHDWGRRIMACYCLLSNAFIWCKNFKYFCHTICSTGSTVKDPCFEG